MFRVRVCSLSREFLVVVLAGGIELLVFLVARSYLSLQLVDRALQVLDARGVLVLHLRLPRF